MKSDVRASIKKARRVVIKVGSSTLARDEGAYARMRRLCPAAADAWSFAISFGRAR